MELSAIQLILMGSVFTATVLVSETPTGVVADLYSRRLSLIISHTGMGVALIWAVASLNFWVILPAQALAGVAYTFESGADVAWLTDELKPMGVDDDEIERLLLRKHRFSIVVGIVTVGLSMVIGTVTSVRWGILLIGLCELGVAVLFALRMSEDHFEPGRTSHRGFFETLLQGLSVISGKPRLRVLIFVVLLVSLGADGFDRLGYKHFLDTLDVKDDSILVLGALFIVMAFGGLAVNHLATRRLAHGAGVARLAVLLLAIAVLGAVIAAFGGAPAVIAVGFTLQDSVRESLYPVFTGWANRDAPSEVRATVHSMVGQTIAVGELVGGLVVGVIAEATSIPNALAVVGGIWMIATIMATRGIEPRPP